MRSEGWFAYQAWVAACGRTGVNVKPGWDDLLEDERYQWAAVERAVRDDERSGGQTVMP